jgi:AraC family transcriptional regulator
MLSFAGTTGRIFYPDTMPVFSSCDQWSGFSIDQHLFPPMRTQEHAAERHTITFNMGAPINFSYRSPAGWRKYLCHQGAIVRLASFAANEETQWDKNFYALSVAFEPIFIDRLLEIENFKFKKEHNIHDPFLREISLKVHQAAGTSLTIEKMYIESLIMTCAIHLATQYAADYKKIFAPKGKLSSVQLSRVIDYTRSFVHANISLNELASTVHLSAYHFARLFRQTLGISPYQFVLQLKIEHAKKLIQNHHGPLSEIAYSLNFTDQAHFSNVFKKITGVSPRTFLPQDRHLAAQ